jgi:hypothetical protein
VPHLRLTPARQTGGEIRKPKTRGLELLDDSIRMILAPRNDYAGRLGRRFEVPGEEVFAVNDGHWPDGDMLPVFERSANALHFQGWSRLSKAIPKICSGNSWGLPTVTVSTARGPACAPG